MINFGPDNEDSYYNLYEKVTSVGLIEPSKDSITKFQQLLNKHKTGLSKLKFDVCTTHGV